MPAIEYKPFLGWSRKNLSAIKRAGDRLAVLERTDLDTTRWLLLVEIGNELAPSLSYLSTLTDPAESVEDLEAKILELVNAPIETAAKVEREVRDAAWLKRVHAACNWLVEVIDAEFDDPTEKTIAE